VYLLVSDRLVNLEALEEVGVVFIGGDWCTRGHFINSTKTIIISRFDNKDKAIEALEDLYSYIKQGG